MPKLARIEIQQITTQGTDALAQPWAWKWDDKDPWPQRPTKYDAGRIWVGVLIHGHLYIQDGEQEINLPLHLKEEMNAERQVWQRAEELLKPIARAIAASKEKPLQNVFGGIAVSGMHMINWALKSDMPTIALPHPYGVMVQYSRFSKSGDVLNDYYDLAMWEMAKEDMSVVIETHRGPLPSAIALEFTSTMRTFWDAVTNAVASQEAERLGLDQNTGEIK